MIDGLARALQIVEAEIARAESLLALEDGGTPVFDRAQTEAGIAALRTVAAAIERELLGSAGVDLPDAAGLYHGRAHEPGEVRPCTRGVKGLDRG